MADPINETHAIDIRETLKAFQKLYDRESVKVESARVTLSDGVTEIKVEYDYNTELFAAKIR